MTTTKVKKRRQAEGGIEEVPVIKDCLKVQLSHSLHDSLGNGPGRIQEGSQCVCREATIGTPTHIALLHNKLNEVYTLVGTNSNIL